MKYRFYATLLCLSFTLGVAFSQVVTTVAGTPEIEGEVDGEALTEALFNNPHGIAIDSFGIVYIADRWNHKIRRLSPNGIVSTIAGTGQVGTEDGPGNVSTFHEPWGLCSDPIGNLYIADTRNNLIRKIDTAGNVSTYAGTGAYGVKDGPAGEARFANPTGITINPSGILFVCDHLGHTIRSISPGGTVATIAGIPFTTGSTDGIGTEATFHRPYGIELDHDGNIIVADEWNHLIRKVTPAGIVSTVAGTGALGSIDGPASSSKFNYPWDVVSDPGGNIYVMDGDNHVIRLISPSGFVSTYVGEASRTGATDGIGIEAAFNGATAICMDHYSGELYIGDAYNNLIRKVSPLGIIGIRSSEYGSGDSICVGTEVNFIAQPAIYTQYDFLINGEVVSSSSSPEFTYVFEEEGRSSVQVDGLAGNGAKISSSQFFLNVLERPIAAMAILDSTRQENPDGLRVSFDATTSIAKNWYWDFGDPSSGTENISFEKSPVHVYQSPGTYSVELVLGQIASCLDTLVEDELIYYSLPQDSVIGNGNNGIPIDSTNNPLEQGDIFIPSAFSPNDDGINDVLFVRGKDIVNLNFNIFDEWGNSLFQSSSIENGWDGNFRGEPVSVDTYAYMAEITLANGNNLILTGHITVLR